MRKSLKIVASLVAIVFTAVVTYRLYLNKTFKSKTPDNKDNSTDKDYDDYLDSEWDKTCAGYAEYWARNDGMDGKSLSEIVKEVHANALAQEEHEKIMQMVNS